MIIPLCLKEKKIIINSLILEVFCENLQFIYEKKFLPIHISYIFVNAGKCLIKAG